ncbi:MAG: LysR family transcriptional regulator, partial [Lachnospiraceae bacterium]|nr:LysR family transcriptional regulator [Lachnospiraceae bacterium]
KAAKSLYITPQGLGKILDRLEQEAKVKLFERTKQGLIPTEAGVFFYENSQKILECSRELEQGLEALRNNRDSFSLGYSCGLVRMIPVHEFEKFQENMGNIKILLEEASNQDVKNRLLKREFDAALVIGRVAAGDFIEEEIAKKSMCAVVPKGHSLFERESIKIADLKDEQLISLNEKYQSYINLVTSCDREGFYPNIRVKTMEASMIYEFVLDGLGIGIDVDIHREKTVPKSVKMIPIEDGIPWSVYFIYPKDSKNSDVIQLFKEWF